MSAKKILSYGRFFLMLLLAMYLVLVWLFFKDNAQQLTSSGLLLWFVIIPLLLLSSIMALLWWQKKQDKDANAVLDSNTQVSNVADEVHAPETHQLFIYSSVCLPEGSCWSEVIDNHEDLTVLSENLENIDGLPLLIKPITRLTEAAFLPYVYDANLDFDDETFEETSTHTEQMSSLNSTTLRLHSLVYELLILSEDILSTLAEHFHQTPNHDNTQSNSAIHVHPEWQQHYLISANEAQNEDTSALSHSSLSEFSIYLCLPSSADSVSLTTAIKKHLTEYLIPESVFSITPIITDDDSHTIDGTPTCNINEFINKHVVPLSQSDDPELCLILIADSQINDEWLDTHLFTEHGANSVPTEAGTLLIFFNKAAQNVLNIDNTASVLLTEFGISDIQSNDNDERHYFNHLATIKNLLIKNAMSLSPTNLAEKQASKRPPTKHIDTKNKTNVFLKETTIQAISDINPLIQPYDISVYLNFLEAFIAQEALVNEHHLGHYMSPNSWLKSFISLSLFVDLTKENEQELKKIFLITQHKQRTMLWLANDF